MEAGEYVKVKEWNVIGRILKVTGRKVYIDSLGFGLSLEQIEKHSKNIIDLIEPGDYVNGNLVLDNNKVYLLVSTSDFSNSKIFNWGIKSIVTREQFASMEYKIEAEDK